MKSTDKVAFTEGNQSTGMTKVAMMNLDGSGREYVTDENAFGSIPSYHEKSNTLAYAEWKLDKKNGLSNPQIAIIDMARKVKTTITSDNWESWRPIFSPEGNDVYYISKRNKQFDIFRYDLRGRREYQVTQSSYDEWDPAISDDGKYLAFAAKKNRNWDLFLLNLATHQVTQMTNSLGNEWDPCFSAGGKFLYFAGTFGLRDGIFRIPLSF